MDFLTVGTAAFSVMSMLSYAIPAVKVRPNHCKVHRALTDNDLIALLIVPVKTQMPICASISMTFSGVWQECKKIPRTL